MSTSSTRKWIVCKVLGVDWASLERRAVSWHQEGKDVPGKSHSVVCVLMCAAFWYFFLGTMASVFCCVFYSSKLCGRGFSIPESRYLVRKWHAWNLLQTVNCGSLIAWESLNAKGLQCDEEEVEPWGSAKPSFTEFLSMNKGDLFVCLFSTHLYTFQWELPHQFF